MLCPICNQVLSQVAVPSYLGNVYYCDNCEKNWWYRQVVVYCPRCRREVNIGYQLLDENEPTIKVELCPDCLNDIERKDD